MDVSFSVIICAGMLIICIFISFLELRSIFNLPTGGNNKIILLYHRTLVSITQQTNFRFKTVTHIAIIAIRTKRGLPRTVVFF